MLARRRRWSLVYAGAGIAVLMVGFQLGRIRGSSTYHRAASQAGVPPDISNALWGPLIGGLDLAARLILIFGAVMVLVGLITVFWHRGR